MGDPGYNTHKFFWKESDVIGISPSLLWVIMDEDELSINDCRMWISPVVETFVDIPGFYHGGAASLAFADGHSDLRKWVDPRTILGNRGPSPRNKDILWLQKRSTVHK